MSLLTFRDFSFRANHHLVRKHAAAGLPHWHSYVVRLWFTGQPDQDTLLEQIERRYQRLHGCALNAVLHPKESGDEELAAWFLADAAALGQCVRVTVTNDGQRGAEVEA